MERKLFIGSSSEGTAIAKTVQQTIHNECSDWIQPDTWRDGAIFSLNRSALDSLVRAARRYDYGVLVATADDIRDSRGEETLVPRDNVLFEMGMFLGSLGLTRAFLLVEDGTALLTDYNGITVAKYKNHVEGSLEAAIKQIITALNNTKNTYALKPIPSTALALGYFDSLVQNFAKQRLEKGDNFKFKVLLPNNLHDIDLENKIYKNNYPSKTYSVVKDCRPIVNEYMNMPDNYWDIPSTLSTLHRTMEKVSPSLEVGNDPEKTAWIEYELRNFKGTVEMLIRQCKACQGRVTVEFIQ